jgi:hypothetical protein
LVRGENPPASADEKFLQKRRIFLYNSLNQW